MTYKDLIDYCRDKREGCIGCPYKYSSCNQFIEKTGCSPWLYDFLKQAGKENDERRIN